MNSALFVLLVMTAILFFLLCALGAIVGVQVVRNALRIHKALKARAQEAKSSKPPENIGDF